MRQKKNKQFKPILVISFGMWVFGAILWSCFSNSSLEQTIITKFHWAVVFAHLIWFLLAPKDFLRTVILNKEKD